MARPMKYPPELCDRAVKLVAQYKKDLATRMARSRVSPPS
jgi:hypothetical protein